MLNAADIDRRQAYLHLRAAASSMREAALYLTACDRPAESNRVIELEKQALELLDELQVTGD